MKGYIRRGDRVRTSGGDVGVVVETFEGGAFAWVLSEGADLPDVFWAGDIEPEENAGD